MDVAFTGLGGDLQLGSLDITISTQTQGIA